MPVSKSSGRVLTLEEEKKLTPSELDIVVSAMFTELDHQTFVARCRKLENFIFSKQTKPHIRLQMEWVKIIAKYHLQEIPKAIEVKKPQEFIINLSGYGEDREN